MADLDSVGLSQFNIAWETVTNEIASPEIFGLLAPMGDAGCSGLSERPYQKNRKNSCPGWSHPAIKEIQQLGQSRLSGNEATSKPLGSSYRQEYTGKLEYPWVTYAPEYWANANRRQESSNVKMRPKKSS